MQGSHGTVSGEWGLPAWRLMAQTAALTLSVMLFVIAGVLLLRGLAGGLVIALARGEFLLSIAMSVALSAGIRLSYMNIALAPDTVHRRWFELAVNSLPCAAVVFMLIALSLPGQDRTAVAVGTILVLIGEGTCWWVVWRLRASAGRRTDRSVRPASSTVKPSLTPATQSLARDSVEPEEVSTSDLPCRVGSDLSDAVSQQMWRIELPDGSQRWQGRCRALFAPSSRHSVEHVAFCPAFPTTPRMECRVLTGPPVRLRLGRVLPYGASVELRLTETASEPVSVTFEFTAAERSN